MTAMVWGALSPHDCKDKGGVPFGTGCETPHYVADVFLFSCLLFLGTFTLSMALKSFRTTRFFPNRVRTSAPVVPGSVLARHWYQGLY